MNNVEQEYDTTHQCRIEDVQIDLMTEKVPICALNVLRNTKDRSYHDKHAGGEEYPHVQAPWDLAGLGSLSRLFAVAGIEGHRDDHEEAEEHELKSEAADDDPFARDRCVPFFLGEEAGA